MKNRDAAQLAPEVLNLAIEFDKVRCKKIEELLGACGGVALLGVIPVLGAIPDGGYPGLAKGACIAGVFWWAALTARCYSVANRYDAAANPNSGYRPTNWAVKRALKSQNNTETMNLKVGT